MATFNVSTLGCKVNTYESEGYVQALIEQGHQMVDFKEQADIYIINTCAVTNAASAKSRQKINQAIRQNPKALICVVGCYAQTSEDEVLKMDNVDLIIGTNHKNQLAVKIEELLQQERKAKVSVVEKTRTANTFEALNINRFQKQTRAFLKVQDGCNQFCSYCIIPFARGVERSLPLDKLIEQANTLVRGGHQEIVLAGIHTGRYGVDLGIDLTYAIKQMLAQVPNLQRIRISSIEIGEISNELLQMMAEDERIAKHLHIPMQAATDEMLKAMNRHYNLQEFSERLAEIRQLLPGVSISTDIIIGFPNESEELYLESYKNLEQLNFSFIHVFSYSKRDNTAAARMSGHLNNDVKKVRSNELLTLSNKTYEAYKASFINKEVSVIFEKYSDGYLFGHSSEYLPVKVKANPSLVHTMQNVVVDSLEDGNLIAHIKGA